MFKEVKRFFKIISRWTPIIARYLAAYAELHIFHPDMTKRHMWLITEKHGEARDNGYHLFKFLRTEHPELDVRFVITSDSTDRSKVEPYGNLVEQDSREHFLYYLAAECSIGSQCSGAYPMIMVPEVYRLTRPLRRKGQKCVFLQHGVTQNALDHKDWFYSEHVQDLIVASAEREREFIERIYGYPPGYVQNLGFCRFDNLCGRQDDAERIVLVMPTWRKWLSASDITKPATAAEMETFKRNEYFARYSELLHSDRLLKILQKYDYRLIFYPHYALQSYISAFCGAEEDTDERRIFIASRRRYDVQELIIKSAVLITDYSSVLFDFAYMDKPMVFYQFDEKEFRDKHYREGYFSYKDDGFGEVVQDKESLLDELEAILESGCKLAPKYVERRDRFFEPADGRNCERNYEAILKLLDRTKE
ncbi:MAG: CDP-glycerol glycerophosphotransferase family protein [Christensenellaceae bacterium]|nr:CDP-glycerol glycerophosphotransferase family protein [Christensenellaceae bacterium]